MCSAWAATSGQKEEITGSGRVAIALAALCFSAGSGWVCLDLSSMEFSSLYSEGWLILIGAAVALAVFLGFLLVIMWYRASKRCGRWNRLRTWAAGITIVLTIGLVQVIARTVLDLGTRRFFLAGTVPVGSDLGIPAEFDGQYKVTWPYVTDPMLVVRTSIADGILSHLRKNEFEVREISRFDRGRE